MWKENTSLRDGIIAEIIGGGVIAVFVAGMLLYLESKSQFEGGKSNAFSFLKNKLVLDISDMIERGPTAWTHGSNHAFYFDASFINPLFIIYMDNISKINEFLPYFANDEFIETFNKFYLQVRKGLIKAEKLENFIKNFVRTKNHTSEIDKINDMDAIKYLKTILFAERPVEAIMKHLPWKNIPSYINEYIEEV